jgi:hypothetical protein
MADFVRVLSYDTYRVYLLFDDKVGASMYAVYGDEYSALSIHTDDGSSFYQVESPFGTDTGAPAPWQRSCPIPQGVVVNSCNLQSTWAADLTELWAVLGGVHPAMYEVKPEARFDSWLTFNQVTLPLFALGEQVQIACRSHTRSHLFHRTTARTRTKSTQSASRGTALTPVCQAPVCQARSCG